MKFIADRMLERLARWLRLFGYDISGIKRQEDEDDTLLVLAQAEGRILVSRDEALIRRAIKKGIRAYLVKSSEITEQLREMQKEFNIKFEPVMDRCSLCNSPVRKVEPSEMELVRSKDYVYPATLENVTEFWVCDKCGQVYWQGKHWKNIVETVKRLEGPAVVK